MAFSVPSTACRKSGRCHFFEEAKFGQPEVARICKELILQAKSTTREAGKAGLHEMKVRGAGGPSDTS